MSSLLDLEREYEESSESARRHSREAILDMRKDNEEQINNLVAEHESLNSVISESLALDDEMALLKKLM